MSEALLAAAKKGDKEEFERLILLGSDIKYCNASQENSVLMAASEGHTEILKIIDQKYGQGLFFEKNKKGLGALHLAAMGGHQDTLQYLISKDLTIEDRCQEGCTPFLFAARHGQIEVLKLLKAQGASTKAKTKKGRTALLLAASAGSINTVDFLVQECEAKLREERDLEGCTAFLTAVIFERIPLMDHLNRLDELLKTQKSIQNDTALCYAAMYGKCASITWLMERGANINDKGRFGLTPFLLAVGSGAIPVIDQFVDVYHITLEEHVESNVKNTAAHIAARYGKIAVLRHLIEVKKLFNASVKNKVGKTPLMAAAMHDQTETIDYLIGQQADPQQRDDHGFTALLCAAWMGQINALQHLIRHHRSSLNEEERHKRNAFLIAAKRGHVALTTHLLALDPGMIYAKDFEQSSALRLAARSGHFEMIILLLKSGIVLNSLNNQYKTLLQEMKVPNQKHPEILVLLIKANRLLQLAKEKSSAVTEKEIKEILDVLGDGVNARRREDGNTALHLALLNGNSYLAIRLLKAGADSDLLNLQRKPARQIFLETSQKRSDSEGGIGYLKALFNLREINKKLTTLQEAVNPDEERKEIAEFLEILTFISETEKLVAHLQDEEKNDVCFQLGELLSRKGKIFNPKLAFDLLVQVGKGSNTLHSKKASLFIFELVMSGQVPNPFKEVDDKNSGDQKVGLEENENSSLGEATLLPLRLRFEIEHLLHSEEQDFAPLGRFVADYCEQTNLQGIKGLKKLNGCNVPSILNLLEDMREYSISSTRTIHELEKELARLEEQRLADSQPRRRSTNLTYLYPVSLPSPSAESSRSAMRTSPSVSVGIGVSAAAAFPSSNSVSSNSFSSSSSSSPSKR